MIPLDECVDRGLYIIDSRNLSIGIFRRETSGFIGIRTKFNHRYLFEEYHWDTGAPFGTVTPLKFVCMLPEEIEVKEGDSRDATPEEKKKWGHEESLDIKVFETYKPLFEYLEKKYDELEAAGLIE